MKIHELKEILICMIQQQINKDNAMITLIQDTNKKRGQLLLKLADYDAVKKYTPFYDGVTGKLLNPLPLSKPKWEHSAGCDDEQRSRWGCDCERNSLGEEEYFKWHTPNYG